MKDFLKIAKYLPSDTVQQSEFNAVKASGILNLFKELWEKNFHAFAP
jgi:hypothetical protein